MNKKNIMLISTNNILITFIITLVMHSFSLAQTIEETAEPFDCDLVEVVKSIPTSDTFIYVASPTSTTLDTSNLLPPQSIDKTQFWVHGLGGDENDWTQAITATQLGAGSSFPARDVDANPIKYDSYDMDAAVTGMINHMDNSNPIASYDNSYVIAHSQGGLVSRYADQLWYNNSIATSRQFNGIVTYGTAHLGAQVINNRTELEAFINEAANELTLGPWASVEQGINVGGINLFVLLGVVPNSHNGVNLLFGDFYEQFKSFLGGAIITSLDNFYNVSFITDQYKVGSSFLNNNINNHTTTMDGVVAFYGNETKNHRFLRFLNWTYYNDVNQPDPNGVNNKFTANNDLSFKYNEFDPTYERFLSEEENARFDAQTAQNKIYENGCNGFFRWIIPLLDNLCSGWETTRDLADDRALAYQRGVTFLNTANDKWEAVIGAREPIFEEVTTKWCQCKDGDDVEEWQIWDDAQCFSKPGPNYDCSIIMKTETKRVAWRIIPNDGLILTESASTIPNTTEGTNFFKTELVGSSHFQMRNDENTKNSLKDLYNGMYLPIFSVDEL